MTQNVFETDKSQPNGFVQEHGDYLINRNDSAPV